MQLVNVAVAKALLFDFTLKRIIKKSRSDHLIAPGFFMLSF